MRDGTNEKKHGQRVDGFALGGEGTFAKNPETDLVNGIGVKIVAVGVRDKAMP